MSDGMYDSLRDAGIRVRPAQWKHTKECIATGDNRCICPERTSPDPQPQLGTCQNPNPGHRGLHAKHELCRGGWQLAAPQARPAPPENPRTWVDKTPAYVEGEPEEKGGGESGWLIEKGGLCLGNCESRVAWVTFTDPNAIRFARKLDALNMKASLEWSKEFGKQLFKAQVTEHMWCGARVSVGAQPGLEERERLAEWFFNNEAEEQEADDKRHRHREQKYARWPEDAATQPYCRWAYRRADTFIAHFGQARSRTGSSPERAAHPESRGAGAQLSPEQKFVKAVNESLPEWRALEASQKGLKQESALCQTSQVAKAENGQVSKGDQSQTLAAPPSSPGAPHSRADDNLNSAVRQYRHAVHGMDCTCKDCTRLLKILVSDNYELSPPVAATGEKECEK